MQKMQSFQQVYSKFVECSGTKAGPHSHALCVRPGRSLTSTLPGTSFLLLLPLISNSWSESYNDTTKLDKTPTFFQAGFELCPLCPEPLQTLCRKEHDLPVLRTAASQLKGIHSTYFTEELWCTLTVCYIHLITQSIS